MKEPQIVYCSNGHIYDAALNDSCPYCKKIQLEKDRLDSVLEEQGGHAIFRSAHSDTQEDDTEFIDRDNILRLANVELNGLLDSSEVGDTELLLVDVNEIDGPTEEPAVQEEDVTEDATELLFDDKEKEQLIDRPARELVAGWLVCAEGKERGKSYELASAYTQMIHTDTDEIYVMIGPHGAEKVEIGFSRAATGIFFLNNSANVSCLLDGKEVYGQNELKPYSRIQIYGRTYVFVPFVGADFEWEEL